MYSNEEFLLELLTEAGYVTSQNLQQVKASRKGQETTLETLLKTGVVSDEQLAQLVSSNSGMEFVDLHGFQGNAMLKTLIPVIMMQSRNMSVRLWARIPRSTME